MKCVPLQKRLLNFNCKFCRNNNYIKSLLNIIEDKETIIKNQDNVIKLLQEKITLLEINNASSTPKPLYADVLSNKNGIDSPENVPGVVIKPKNVQDSKKTRNDISKNIDLVNLKIGVKTVRNTNSGAVIIKCHTKRETEILEDAVANTLKDTYNVERTKMLKPRIKITNFNQDMPDADVEKSIIEQNSLMDDFKVTYIKTGRSGNKVVYGECSAFNFKKFMNMKKVCIGWERYPVYEDLNIPRCFKCQEFYHKKQNCTKDIICPICSENHEERECPKQRKLCTNCCNANNKYHLNYDTNHQVNDPECQTLQYHVKLRRSKIDYYS